MNADDFQRLDAAISGLLLDFSALEVARDETGSLLAFADATTAARFALSLRETLESPVAFAIEQGVERIDESPGRPVRVIGPGLRRVDELVALASAGQVLARAAVATELECERGLRVSSLDAFALGTDGDPVFEIERSGERIVGLPRAKSALVGRDAELERALELIRAGARSSSISIRISIVGPVGVGKTRLAIEVAARSPFANRCAFVELRDANTEDDAIRALARALGSTSGEPEPLTRRERVVEVASSGVVDLIVLDGVDTLGLGRWLVDELLSGESPPRILMTGREPLGHSDESVLRLSPLDEAEALLLFAQRSGSADAIHTNVEMVRALDGLPLAIELVAARARERSATELLNELTELDRGLAGAIAGSHRALSENERRLLALLAVLPAGLAAECAEALPATNRARATLEGLCQKSIAVEESAGSNTVMRRFRTLDCVRRFVLRELGPQGRVEVSQSAARAILACAERWAEGAEGKAPAPFLDRLAEELENLAALHAALAALDPEQAVRCVMVAEPLLRARGPRDLHLALLASAVQVARRVDRGLACDVALARAEALANTYGDPSSAREELQALDAASLRGAREARARWLQGVCAFADGRYAEAERLENQALAGFVALDDVAGAARASNTLGNIQAHQGRFEQAQASYEAALAGHERTGELRKGAVVLQNLARLASEAAEHERAAVLHERALALSRQLGDARVEAMGLSQSALAAHDRGELDTATRDYATAVQLFSRTGEWRFHGWTQVLFALAALERNDDARATELMERCAPRDPLTQGLRAAVLAVLATRSGDLEAASNAFEDARRLTSGDPHLTAAVHVLAGILDLARSAERRAAGFDADADALQSSARGRWASVSTALSPSTPVADRSCLVRVTIRLLAAALGAPLSVHDTTPSLEVAEDASWFRRSSETRVDLTRRLPLRRLLAFLATQRRETPSVPVKANDLVAAGWPGERIEKRAAHNRLYVAIATLRRAGLGDALITRQDGYMLDPNLPIVFRTI